MEKEREKGGKKEGERQRKRGSEEIEREEGMQRERRKGT